MKVWIPRWGSFLQFHDDNVEVWCDPFATRVPCIHRSQDKALGIGVFVKCFFKTHLYFQLPTTRLIGDVCVTVFKMPYPSSATASIHVGVSISTLKSRMCIRCRNFLVNRKLCHNNLPEWHVHAAVLSNWNTTTCWRQVIWFLFWSEVIDGISCYLLRHAKLRGICS
jgi:hypothetical protein